MDSTQGIGLAIASMITIIGMWRLFARAGEPGWAALVPFYNLIVLLRVASKPAWWVILLCIPVVNVVCGYLVCKGVAARFGRGTVYALGLTFLAPIFLWLVPSSPQPRYA